MTNVNWNDLAKSKSFQAVIDPLDSVGVKNALIDQIHWDVISKSLGVNGTVLDFGCGIGRFAQRIVGMGLKYYGTDTSIGMIDSAKKLNTSDNVEFIHSSCLPFKFSDGYFNVCLSVYVLQYLINSKEHVDVFSELARVLKKGGQLLIIEQASCSGRSSFTVKESSNEAAYIEALSDFFIIEKVERIRCSKLTRLSSIYLRYGKYLFIKRLLIPFLAKQEAKQALNFGPDEFNKMDYYDIFVRAIKK